jgi:ketosteroid isomerase-like protein
MPKETVDVVRALLPPPDLDLAALFREESRFQRLVGALEPLIDPEVEAVAVWQGGSANTYVGIEGFKDMWLDWLQPWSTYHTQVEDLIDAGDRVVVLVRDRARRHDSDAEVELMAGSVWEIRDGRIVRVEFCGNREQALEAAGLRQ